MIAKLFVWMTYGLVFAAFTVLWSGYWRIAAALFLVGLIVGKLSDRLARWT